VSRLQEWCLAFSAVSTFSYLGGIRHFQAVARPKGGRKYFREAVGARRHTPDADAERQAIENSLASFPLSRGIRSPRLKVKLASLSSPPLIRDSTHVSRVMENNIEK
jgi:hypothetical protein